jgi:hypothetical protein
MLLLYSNYSYTTHDILSCTTKFLTTLTRLIWLPVPSLEQVGGNMLSRAGTYKCLL